MTHGWGAVLRVRGQTAAREQHPEGGLRMQLCFFRAQHLPDFVRIRSHPDTGRFLNNGCLGPERAAVLGRALLANSDEERAHWGSGTWAVRHADVCIGFVGFSVWDDAQRASLFFMLDPNWRGRGFGTRAVQAALREKALRGDERASVALVQTHNLASQKVVLRCGYVLFGLLGSWGRECWLFKREP